MELKDLKPYFELYNNLKDAGKDTILNFELGKKEREYAGKEIRLEGIVSEIDLLKNELILTCQTVGADDSIHIISSAHFFIFAYTSNLGQLLTEGNVELDDLVKIDGTINTLHRNSVIRLTLNRISVVQKKYRQNKASKRGCFIATAVYGSAMAPAVHEFYRIRDEYLASSRAGRVFISLYYSWSPAFARWISKKPRIKQFIRVYLLDKILHFYRERESKRVPPVTTSID